MKINRIIEAVVCFGAVLVIFGSWAKLTHKPFADLFLTIGLITECVIFFIYGIEALYGKAPNQEPSYQSTSDKLIPLSDNKELTTALNENTDTLKKIYNLR